MIKNIFIIFISLFIGINLNSSHFLFYLFIDIFILLLFLIKRDYKRLFIYSCVNLLALGFSFIKIDLTISSYLLFIITSP